MQQTSDASIFVVAMVLKQEVGGDRAMLPREYVVSGEDCSDEIEKGDRR